MKVECRVTAAVGEGMKVESMKVGKWSAGYVESMKVETRKLGKWKVE